MSTPIEITGPSRIQEPPKMLAYDEVVKKPRGFDFGRDIPGQCQESRKQQAASPWQQRGMGFRLSRQRPPYRDRGKDYECGQRALRQETDRQSQAESILPPPTVGISEIYRPVRLLVE